jgi:hypothetical protein
MSAHFHLRYREQFVRLTYLAGQSVAQIVDRKQATSFRLEAEAWHAAYAHHLRSDWCEVQPASQSQTKQLELGAAR